VANDNRQALAEVDEAALDAYLAGLLGGDGATTQVSLLSGGASNLTFQVRYEGSDYVLRRRPLGKVNPRAHDMSREYTVLAALRETDIPVPSVHGFSDDESIAGAPFYVMDFVPGRVVDNVDSAAAVGRAGATHLSEDLVDVLARLHALDLAEIGLDWGGREPGLMSRRLERWLEQWQSSDHRDLPEVERVAELLRANLPSGDEMTLLHGDYRLGNVLVTATDPVSVAAVLDWELSTVGDPLTDLAHLLVYWEPTRGRITHPGQLVTELPGFLPGSALVERYGAATGRSVDGLDFYLAYEHWRAAIIKEAIVQRGMRGELPDEDTFEHARGTVPLHLAEAMEIVSGAAASRSTC
jgi:aminoglycoside phosphotransferase (APT) family kinase protein